MSNPVPSTIPKGNVWRSVWRICMWILGLEGLIILLESSLPGPKEKCDIGNYGSQQWGT